MNRLKVETFIVEIQHVDQTMYCKFFLFGNISNNYAAFKHMEECLYIYYGRITSRNKFHIIK